VKNNSLSIKPRANQIFNKYIVNDLTFSTALSLLDELKKIIRTTKLNPDCSFVKNQTCENMSHKF